MSHSYILRSPSLSELLCRVASSSPPPLPAASLPPPTSLLSQLPFPSPPINLPSHPPFISLMSSAGGSFAAAVALVICVGQVAVDTGGFAGGNGAAAVAAMAAMALLAPRLAGAARALKRGASRAGGWAGRRGRGKPPASPVPVAEGDGAGGVATVARGDDPPASGAATAVGEGAAVVAAATLPALPLPLVVDEKVLTAATVLTMEDYTTAEEGDGSTSRRTGGRRDGRRGHRGRRTGRWGGGTPPLPRLPPPPPPPQGWRTVYATRVAAQPEGTTRTAVVAAAAAAPRGPAPPFLPPPPPTSPSLTDSASTSAGSTAWAPAAGCGERRLPPRPRLPRRPRPRGRPRHVCVEV